VELEDAGFETTDDGEETGCFEAVRFDRDDNMEVVSLDLETFHYKRYLLDGQSSQSFDVDSDPEERTRIISEMFILDPQRV